MTATAKRRLLLVVALSVASAALGFISFGSMGENLVYYWDPTQLVAAGDKAYGATVRLGGIVKPGTVDWKQGEGHLNFEVTDNTQTVRVAATGAPPQMFREGIGVVVEGTLARSGVFEADRLMVKHSNEYRAPEEGKAPHDLYETVEDM